MNKMNIKNQNKCLKALSTKMVVGFFVLFVGVKSFAQVSVEVKMDTSMLLIGDQTKVHLKATYPNGTFVNMPVFSDTIIDKLEILDISNIDTTFQDDLYTIHQEYLVTNFDSGWYAIPPLDFIVGIPQQNRLDTLQSVPVYFGVMNMQLDTVNRDGIIDIKAPMEAPITFREVAPFVGLGLGILILALLAYILYMKYAKKEPVFIKKEKPKEPAHVIAYRGLDALKEEKLWQKGLVKEYYSALTEVIRIYIEDRWNVLAMESTTDEIINDLKSVEEVGKSLNSELKDVLVRADFVKFAKAMPLADENEKSLDFAYDFIAKTKVVEVLRDEDEKNENTHE